MHEKLKSLLNDELVIAEAAITLHDENDISNEMIDSHREWIFSLKETLSWINLDKPQFKYKTIVIKKDPERWVDYIAMTFLIILTTIGASVVVAVYH